MIIKTLSEPNKKSFWVAVLWTGLLLFLSFKSTTAIPRINITNIDKVVHCMFYFVFVFLWYRFLFFRKLTQNRHKILLVLISICLGIAVEIGQGYFTTSRQADVFDVLANTIGSFCGIFLTTAFFKEEKA